jgi:predicted Rossmann-fold nucleotide-binding protein
VLTAAQLRVHAKPIVLVNVMGYFDALDALVRDTVKKGFASEAVLTLYSLADDAPAALAQVRKALAP